MGYHKRNTSTKTAETSQQAPVAAALSPNRKKHNAAHRKPTTDTFIWDKDYGAVRPNPWKVLPSVGFHVLQIDTRPGLMRKKTQESDDASDLAESA